MRDCWCRGVQVPATEGDGAVAGKKSKKRRDEGHDDLAQCEFFPLEAAVVTIFPPDVCPSGGVQCGMVPRSAMNLTMILPSVSFSLLRLQLSPFSHLMSVRLVLCSGSVRRQFVGNYRPVIKPRSPSFTI
jgi:hypothetical protein